MKEGEGQTSDAHTEQEAKAGKELDKSAPAETNRGKPGKPKGAPGHGRSVELPVYATQLHLPPACALCGEAFSSDASERAYTGRYQVDLFAPPSGAPGLEVCQTVDRYAVCQCSCGQQYLIPVVSLALTYSREIDRLPVAGSGPRAAARDAHASL